MRAGQLNRRITVQAKPAGPDQGGQPHSEWTTVGQIWSSIRHETGASALRATQASGIPVSIVQYSVLVRFADAQRLGIQAGMRVLHDGHTFKINAVSRDFTQRDAVYLICEINNEPRQV